MGGDKGCKDGDKDKADGHCRAEGSQGLCNDEVNQVLPKISLGPQRAGDSPLLDLDGFGSSI